MSKLPTSAESLEYWADMDDVRFRPILKALVSAILDTNDHETLTKLATRLKFMSGSVASYRNGVVKNDV